MSNQLEIEDNNKEQNSPNILIELSEKKSDLNEKLTPSKIIQQSEEKEDHYNDIQIFPDNQSQNFFTNFIIEEKKKYLTKNNIYLCILNLSGILFYHLGLMSCENEDPSECTIKYGIVFYVKLGILDFMSSLLFSIYVTITIYFKKYFLHYLYVLPAYIYYIVKYHGGDTIDHGFYNSIGWIIFSIILVVLLICIFKIFNYIKYKIYKTLMFIVAIIIAISIYYYNLPGFSCDFWDMGLNNTRINNDKNIYPCEVLSPEKDKCYLKKLDGFFDFSKVFRSSCTAESILDGEKKRLLDSLSDKYFGVSKLNHFGYPITINDKYSMYSVTNLKGYQELINHNMIKMDLYNKENYPDESYPEVELFFDQNNHGRIKINITKNETLSRERKEISKNTHSLFNNVLIVYIDTVSRNLFQRKMHKLSKFIEQYMPYNLNEKEKPYTSFQFMKYNTLKGLTLPNIKPMFYGVSLEEDGVNVVKYFKRQGYVTGHTGTTCGKEIFSVNALLKSQRIDYDNWDHENIALFCDPNFFDSGYSLDRGVASYIKRCLYGKYAFEYMIEYSKQFWDLYSDNKKFYRVHFNEAHEGSMELVTYLTDPLFEFVKYFFDNNLLDDTFMFIISDHGHHMLGPWTFIRSQDYVLETTLATLFFIIPNNEKLYENGLYDIIHENQQVFVTPYDIHDTMIQIAYGNDTVGPNCYSKRGSSLLSYINPMERYCENPAFNLKITKNDCKCKLYKK